MIYYKINDVKLQHYRFFGWNYFMHIDPLITTREDSNDKVIYKNDQLFITDSNTVANIVYTSKRTIPSKEWFWDILSKSNNQETIKIILKFLEDK